VSLIGCGEFALPRNSIRHGKTNNLALKRGPYMTRNVSIIT
jgi:hypothetical protein